MEPRTPGFQPLAAAHSQALRPAPSRRCLPAQWGQEISQPHAAVLGRAESGRNSHMCCRLGSGSQPIAWRRHGIQQSRRDSAARIRSPKCGGHSARGALSRGFSALAQPWAPACASVPFTPTDDGPSFLRRPFFLAYRNNEFLLVFQGLGPMPPPL